MSPEILITRQIFTFLPLFLRFQKIVCILIIYVLTMSPGLRRPERRKLCRLKIAYAIDWEKPCVK